MKQRKKSFWRRIHFWYFLLSLFVLFERWQKFNKNTFFKLQTKNQPKLSKFTSKSISYSSVLQSLLNNPNVRVKIADLGNACFDVNELKTAFELILFTNSKLNFFSTIISRMIFRRANIAPSKFFSAFLTLTQRTFGARRVWHLNLQPAITFSTRIQGTTTQETKIT